MNWEIGVTAPVLVRIGSTRYAVPMNRRTICAALAAGLLAGFAGSGDAWGQAKPALKSGPMLGYAEIAETVVWMQTTAPAKVRLRYWPVDKPGDVRTTADVATSPAGDHIAKFALAGLPFGTRFEYRVLLNGKELTFPYPTRFQTQPMWRFRTDPPSFRFAFGSCNYVNDPPFDRPGTPYGGDPAIFTSIFERKPDFMLWVGDNTYFREADWLTEAGLRYRHAHTRAEPLLQPLLGSVHHYATWDDHDFGPNDSDRSYRLKGEALTVFADYFPAVRYGTPETPGCFQRFEWADCEFFLIDDRSFRAPNATNDPNKPMFGEAQMRWLTDALVSSKATFKFVVGGGQFFNDLNRFEGWNLTPGERAGFLDFVSKQGVTGLFFLSGDRHMAELLKVDRPGTYPLWEFTSSPLTAGVSKGHPSEENNPARVPGTWVNDKRNFGWIEVSGKRGERVLSASLCDKDGKMLWTRRWSETDLK